MIVVLEGWVLHSYFDDKDLSDDVLDQVNVKVL